MSTVMPQSGDDALPLVSVIIPTYNYARFLAAAIDSVRRQDYARVEIIVVDDGSTDDTQALLAGMSGLRVVRQENQGLSAARNHGLLLAQGKYLQFLDADDLLGATAIRRRVDMLERHPERAAAVCRSAFFHARPLPEPLARWHAEWRQPEANRVDIALCHFNIAPPHAYLVRRSVVEEAGLRFDIGLRACEDYDFWFRLARVGGLPLMLRSGWVYYRQHAGSMSRSHVNQHRHDALMCRRILAWTAGENLWPGERPPADYLAAMLDASLVTARRLWLEDRGAFPGFMAEHVMAVCRRFRDETRPCTLAALPYLARARVLLAKLYVHDRALDATSFAQADAVFPAGGLWRVALRTGPVADFLRSSAELLRLDMHHDYLMYLARSRSS